MSNICLKCIGDRHLRGILKCKIIILTCSYCEKQQSSVPLGQLAQSVDGFLQRFVQIGEDHPVFHGDSDKPDHEQEGESLENLLEVELDIPFEAAKELAANMIELDPVWPPDGDEPFFVSSQSYHRRLQWTTGEYDQEWQEFSARIKHQRRFFDDEGRLRLARILGEAGSDRSAELPVLDIGPTTKGEILYRARRADSHEEALHIFKNPAANLGPPPPHLALAGRMNAAGIPVFYGALSEDTAVAEVRPSVGSLVVVGEFRPTRKLRLLDLSRIGVGFTGSIFAPEYEDRVDRRRFLEGFHALIARPIQPHHEPLEYIPTQAVAEYVSNVLSLDGILYASAQLGAIPETPQPKPYVRITELTNEELALHNVVLFGAASRVVEAATSDGPNHHPEPSQEPHPAEALKVDPETTSVRIINSVSYMHVCEHIPDPEDSSM